MIRSQTSERFKEQSIQSKDKREHINIENELNFRYLDNQQEKLKKNPSLHKIEDKLIGQQSINEISNYKKQQQSTQQQNQQNISQIYSMQSNFTQDAKFYNKEFDATIQQNTRSPINQDNQKFNNEKSIKEIQQVEIDSEGEIQEKSDNQVQDQNDIKQNNRKENSISDKYIKEYQLKDHLTRKQNNTKLINNENKINMINAKYNCKGDDLISNTQTKLQNNQYNLKQNQNNISFDDQNFMTDQTDNLSQFNTKQTCKVNRFSSISSTSTALFQKKIDDIQYELKEKISFLIALEEELLETKTQLNMQKLDNSSLKERMQKLQKDNHLMQKQISQMGETIKNLEKASNSLVNQIIFFKKDAHQSKDGNQTILNSLDESQIFNTYQEYLNNIVKSNINLRCNLEELNQKHAQLKTQINSTMYTHNSPISTRVANTQLEQSNNQQRNNFQKGESTEERQNISPKSVFGVCRSQSPIQSRQNQQTGLFTRVIEIKEAKDQFVSKYLKNKRRYCNDEQERQFYVEMDNEFQLIRNNVQIIEQFLSEMKLENEVRVKNAREQFEASLKEIELIKKVAEERNKIIQDQVKQIEQENVHLNKTVETYRGNIIENEKGIDESRIKIELYQKSADDYQQMLLEVSENLARKNEELLLQKHYRDKLEEDLNNKIFSIKDLKLEADENNQFIRKLQETIISLQKESQEKQDAFTKALECAQQIKQDSEKRLQFFQQDALQVQQREKEYLEKEIKMKEKENQLLNELSQKDQVISNLQDQINEINISHLNDKKENENNNLKAELNNLNQIKNQFEGNFLELQNQIQALKIENKELKNEDIERKLLCYDKYVQIEQKLGLQQTDVLLLIEKLPLAEQELQTIIGLNQNLQEQLNHVVQENQDYDRQCKELNSKLIKLNSEVSEMKEQINLEREIKKENMKQQIQMNQQLQKQNQVIMQNCDSFKAQNSNLEIQISELNKQIKEQKKQTDELNTKAYELNNQNELLSERCAKYQNCLDLLMKERELIKQQSKDIKLKDSPQQQYIDVQQLIQIKDNLGESQGSNAKQESLRVSHSQKSNNKSYENYQENISPVIKNYKYTHSQRKGTDKTLISSYSQSNLNNMSGQQHFNNIPQQQMNSTTAQLSNRQSSSYTRNQDQSASPSNTKQSQQIYQQDPQQLSAINRISQRKQYTVNQPSYQNQSKIIYY